MSEIVPSRIYVGLFHPKNVSRTFRSKGRMETIIK
jgi:hypothetical protein